MTLGQLAPVPPPGTTPGQEFLQLSVVAGAGYVVPENGTITSWSHNAVTGSGEKITMKVYRKTSEPGNFYKVIGLDGPEPLIGNKVNTFPVSIPVQAGDVLGGAVEAGTVAILFGTGQPGDTFLNHLTPPDLAVGDEAGFTGPNMNSRLNLSAVFEPTPPAPPSNAFTVAGTTLNKKKGTATLNLTLPGPGDLTATGNGVSAASAGHAAISKAVGAGPAQLLIKAVGKKKKKLTQNGKVTLSVAITYTPTGGKPSTQSVSVKLKKK